MKQTSVIEQIIHEARRATAKFPTWPTDPLHALAVLGEEFGELTKAMLQHTYEPHKGVTQEDIRDEAIQTAAMALRLAMSLDRYEYRATQQHAQDAIDADERTQSLEGFAKRFLDPEDCGWSVNEAIRDHARRVLGMRSTETAHK